jgi:hypothetical protein
LIDDRTSGFTKDRSYLAACEPQRRSHRDVDMDFLSAFERIVVASDLLKIVERAGDMAQKKR